MTGKITRKNTRQENRKKTDTISTNRNNDLPINLLEEFVEQDPFDGVVLIDSNGIIVQWNKKQTQFSGLQKKDVIGKKLWEVLIQLIPNDSRVKAGKKHLVEIKKFKERILNTINNKSFYRKGRVIETKIVNYKTGKQYFVQQLPFIITTQKGDYFGSVFRDITNEVIVNEQEKLLMTVLRHDLRNRIQLIDSYLHLLANQELPAEGSNIVAKIRKTVQDSSAILDKINTLELVDIDTPTKINLLDVIKSAINKNDIALSDSNIELDVAEKSLNVNIQGGALLEELFHNLIENSFKHSKCKKIRITGKKTPTKIVVSYEDDGIGLPDEIKKVIFKKRIKNHQSSGLGLGTYLTNKIVTGYNGKIRVKKSQLGGAGFEITLKRWLNK